MVNDNHYKLHQGIQVNKKGPSALGLYYGSANHETKNETTRLFDAYIGSHNQFQKDITAGYIDIAPKNFDKARALESYTNKISTKFEAALHAGDGGTDEVAIMGL